MPDLHAGPDQLHHAHLAYNKYYCHGANVSLRVWGCMCVRGRGVRVGRPDPAALTHSGRVWLASGGSIL